MPQPFFCMSNVHVESCGEPPTLSNDRPSRYQGYFENRHGEQWIFTLDSTTGKADLRGGDAGWNKSYEVFNGEAQGLILSPDEQTWLKACWMAAKRT